MRVIVALDHRFCRTPDGAVWASTMYDYPFWTRYLEVFDQVRVLGRMSEITVEPADRQRADGPGVSFASLPSYSGPWGYLKHSKTIAETIRRELKLEDAVVLRMSPSQIAVCVAGAARTAGQPYAIEVIADPDTVFAPGALRHPLSPLFRWWLPRQLRHLCGGACAVGYVTREALQRQYPAAPGAFSTSCSDITLTDEAFASEPHRTPPGQNRHRIVFVGTLSQLYKGQDVLIDAVGDCVNRRGLDLLLTMVGDGKYRTSLEAQAVRLGIADRVEFTGHLPAGTAVRDQLDQADLFVLPSRTEGLPKVIIEAMARGLPCIGSNVGGIPELMSPQFMVPPGDVQALSSKMQELLGNPSHMNQAASENLERAREYHNDVLRSRRTALYQHLRDKTTQWLAKHRR